MFCAIHTYNFCYRLISVLAIHREGGLHPKHRIMNYHEFFVDNTPVNARVLDLGCGNGALSYDLAKKAKSVLAIDISPVNINFANKLYSRENITFIEADILNCSSYRNKFDVVILSNILEHLESRVPFLASLSDVAPCLLLRVPLITRDWIVPYIKELCLDYRCYSTHFI